MFRVFGINSIVAQYTDRQGNFVGDVGQHLRATAPLLLVVQATTPPIAHSPEMIGMSHHSAAVAIADHFSQPAILKGRSLRISPQIGWPKRWTVSSKRFEQASRRIVHFGNAGRLVFIRASARNARQMFKPAQYSFTFSRGAKKAS